MPTDRYTKTALTIIAGALLAIVTQNAINSSHAQTQQITKVAICDIRDPNSCAFVTDVAGGQGLVTLTRELLGELSPDRQR